MRTKSFLSFVVAIVFGGLGVTIGTAESLAQGCCADLEARIAELEQTAARKGNRRVSLKISGQLNEAVMFWDDGFESNAYQVSNEIQRTQFRITGTAKISAAWSAGYRIEIGVRGARQDRSNQRAPGPGGLDIRHSAWWLQHEDLGRVWVGQYSQAADGITEINLARVFHFAKPRLNQQIGDGGAGFFLRRTDGVLTTLTYGNIFTQGFNGLPGEGHRLNVVRYVSPTFAGLKLSASWGEDDFWDVALRYSTEAMGFRFAGGIAFIQWTGNTNERGCADDPRPGSSAECHEVGLSASLMHKATGLYVSGAWGTKFDLGRRDLYQAPVEDRDRFAFVQAGIETKFFSIGKTTIFGEFWHQEIGAGLTPQGTILNATPLGAGANIAGAETRMWGVGLNQNMSETLDLYVSYRNVEADVETSANGLSAGATTTEIETFQFITAGALLRF